MTGGAEAFFEAYAVGLCRASACCDAPDTAEGRALVARLMNERHPTGIASRWEISKDAAFGTGQPMPCPCESMAPGRLHWLLSC